MSTEENKALVRRYYDEVVSQHKLEVLDEVIGTAADGARESLKEGHRRTQTYLQCAFPDLHESVEQLIAEDDRVTVVTTFEGTHTGGEYSGIPATGKHLKIPVVGLWRVNRGKLVDLWVTSNLFSVYEQLGVVSIADLLRERNKAVIHRWVEARNANDLEAALQCWSDERQESLKPAFSAFSTGVPDVHLAIEDLVAERDEVVMRGLLTGTHLGVFHGVEPTGKKVEWRFVDTYTIVDGKIASLVRVAPDLLAMLRA